tara:strand:+ start:553 stop:1260 length:708 start_codon:yes stop_codon:yes gene_type:complete
MSKYKKIPPNIKNSNENSDNCSKCYFWVRISPNKGMCRQFSYKIEDDKICDKFRMSAFQVEDFEREDVIREYVNTRRYSEVEREHPISYIPKPTAEDYEKTVMKRYFCQYRSDVKNKIVEINKETYGKLNVSYYRMVEVLWRISGPVEDEYNNGIVVSKGIANANRDTIDLMKKELNGLDLYLTDLTELAYVKGKTLVDDVPAESVFGSGKEPIPSNTNVDVVINGPRLTGGKNN